MQEYIKTLISALQTWVKGLVKKSTADWNQNDLDADNYVKNRTHWEEEKIITEVIQDELSVDFTNCGVQDWEASSIENYIYEYNGSNILEAGKTYNVIYDGQEYTLKAFIDNDFENVVLGNGALVSSANDDNGLPFAIGCYGVDENIGYILSITQETHSFYVSLIETETVIHKLDEKYIPNSLIKQVETAQTTADEAMSAASSVALGSSTVSGVLPIEKGGTGVTTQTDLMRKVGMWGYVDITSITLVNGQLTFDFGTSDKIPVGAIWVTFRDSEVTVNVTSMFFKHANEKLYLIDTRGAFFSTLSTGLHIWMRQDNDYVRMLV